VLVRGQRRGLDSLAYLDVQFGIIAEVFEASAEADHLLEARDEGDDDGNGRVPEGDGAVG
jgi:hypothetical protein